MINIKDFQSSSGYRETIAMQGAINAAAETGQILFLPADEYHIDPVRIDSPVRLQGEGAGTRLIFKDPQSRLGMIQVRRNGSLHASDLVIDGGREHAAENFRATKESSVFCDAKAARIKLVDVEFVNGRAFDVRVIGEGATSSDMQIERCRFSNGAESTSQYRCDSVRVHGNVDTDVTGCSFFGPADSKTGRTGIVFQTLKLQGIDVVGDHSVTRNRFDDCGYDSPHAYGSIDAYQGVRSVKIIGNTIRRPLGRGICVKGDASDVVISGNSVTGLRGKFASGCITAYGSKTTMVGRRMLIQGNTLQTETKGAKGILIDGSDSGDAPRFRGVNVSGNLIDHNGIGILCKFCNGIHISGNQIEGGWKAVVIGEGNVGLMLVHDNIFPGYTDGPFRINGAKEDMQFVEHSNHIAKKQTDETNSSTTLLVGAPCKENTDKQRLCVQGPVQVRSYRCEKELLPDIKALQEVAKEFANISKKHFSGSLLGSALNVSKSLDEFAMQFDQRDVYEA